MNSQLPVNLHAANVQASIFSLAKNHIMAAQIRSSTIFRSIFEKKDVGLAMSKNLLRDVAKNSKSLTGAIIPIISKDIHPLPPTPNTESDDDTDVSVVEEIDSEGSTCALTVVAPTDSEYEEDEPRGRAPRTLIEPTGYRKRYSVGLRGLTPSPVRDSSSEEDIEEIPSLPRCSKQWRSSKRCATPPPLRHSLRRIDRRIPAKPRDSVAIKLVEPKTHQGVEPLPLEGKGWIEEDTVPRFSVYGYISFEVNDSEVLDPDMSWDTSMEIGL